MTPSSSAATRAIAYSLIAGALLLPATPAVAAETDPVPAEDVVSEELDAPIPVEDSILGEGDLVGESGTAAEAAGARTSARTLPYECQGKVDRPHQSHTTNNTINVHFDTKCQRKAPNLSTEGSLYRSRWYGWEHLVSRKGSKKSTWKLRVVAPKKCERDTLYRYRGQARFYVSGSEGRGSTSVYNQNDSEIRCGR